MSHIHDLGRSSPLGATVVDGGVNFSLFSRTAAGVDLLLFDHEDDAAPARVIPIESAGNRVEVAKSRRNDLRASQASLDDSGVTALQL